MATETTTSTEMGPTMVPPLSTAKADFFVIGTDDRPHDTRVVAVSIGCQVDVKVGEREYSTSLPLHEILILRHHGTAATGSCTVNVRGDWVPGVLRYRTLPHDALKAEVERLSKSYITPRKDSPPLESFSYYYPGNMAEKMKKLHTVLGEQYRAFEKLLETAKKRAPVPAVGTHPAVAAADACKFITPQEIDDIINIADPTASKLSELVLPEIENVPTLQTAVQQSVKDLDSIIAEANALADKDAEKSGGGALDRLLDAGLTAPQANAAIALLERHESYDKIPDDALSTAVGKAKLAAAKQALRG